MRYLRTMPIIMIIGMYSSFSNAALVHTFDVNGTDFATLDITPVSGTEYTFTLSVFDPANNLVNGANFNFIDQLLFTASPTAAPTSISSFIGPAQQPTIINVPGQALDAPSGVLFDYDFGFQFAGTDAAVALDRGETASWNATFSAGPVSFNQFGLVVVNNGGEQPKVLGNLSPVPEPQTYAMFLAGLGLMGFAARRKQG